MDNKNKKIQTNAENKTEYSMISTLRYFSLILLVVVMLILFSILSPAFVSYSNIMNIVRQTAITLIVSIGMTFVILSGGIDLSVGSNIAVSGMLGIVVLNRTSNIFVAVFITLLTATVFGLINGLFIGKLGITAFIVTLAMQFVGRGATMLLNGAASIKVNNSFYKFIGQGDVGGIPVSLLTILVLYILFCFVNDFTSFGRKIYAIGGNTDAARASGIHVEKNLVLIYMLAGFICGIGALFTVGRLGSAQPYAGQGVEFDCITAVVLGGTSLEGGKGNLKGTVLGAVLVGIISNGLGLLALPQYFTYLCTGLLILVAIGSDMAITYVTNKRLLPKMDEIKNDDSQEKTVDMSIDEVLKESERVVEMRNITKTFPGMKALDNVSFTIRSGEIHALMGENGAGKSTLMRILSGEETATNGSIYINGQKVDISDPVKARSMGISLIHQEIALIPELTVAQNIFFGKEPRAVIPFFVNKKKMIHDAQDVIDRLGLNIDVKKKVSSLTVSEQQMIEIAKSLESNAWLIIMDEPTSSLTEREKDKLFEIAEKLRKRNMSIVYISHRMQEIFHICDKITILRDGKLVGTEVIGDVSENKIISMMIGRELNNIFDRQPLELGKPLLEVRNLSKRGVFKDISFTIREHEVMGFAGLVGAGRTEIARCICGLDTPDSGEIFINGRKISVKEPSDALKQGIAYVPEDRKRDGFVPLMSICENVSMSSYQKISRAGVINNSEQKNLVNTYIKQLRIKTTSMKKNVVELSGGNQQKVSLANRLAVNPSILILDEPTRGIDIGAKAEIHQLIAEIARKNVAIMLISSEMPELIGCADSIAVLREGTMTGLLNHEEATQASIMSYAAQK